VLRLSKLNPQPFPCPALQPFQRKLCPSDSFKRSSGLLARPRMPIMRADLSHNSIGDGEGAMAIG
jgi:hypothetical protein